MANVSTASKESGSSWSGGIKPFKASYGKLMMWFFLMSDAFTFSTLLIVYGVLRFSSSVDWANPEAVYTHFPGLTEWFHLHPPLAFVGLMTFILIASSVTMVLAVEAGNRMDRKNVEFYMILTIIGGAAFLACQAYEWYNFINGTEFGSLHLADGSIVTLHSDAFLQGFEQMGINLKDGVAITAQQIAQLNVSNLEVELMSGEVVKGETAMEYVKNGGEWFKGANLSVNQYSQNRLFADLFFFITGFHGSHVASGVVLNYVIYDNVTKGVYDKRGHYEMVEKVGLYWHFVDLVWVFVFTFFYLV